MSSNPPYSRRATVVAMAAVTVASGGILLLGERFEATPSYALPLTGRSWPRVAACLADEHLRLIDIDRERCGPDEVELAPRLPGDR